MRADVYWCRTLCGFGGQHVLEIVGTSDRIDGGGNTGVSIIMRIGDASLLTPHLSTPHRTVTTYFPTIDCRST